MKFTVLKENLQKALFIIQRIITKNPSLPILENILIETEQKRLKISATNLELGMHIWVRGRLEKEGKVSVPASLLGNIIANIKEERVMVESKGMNLTITSGSFEGLLKGQDANDFPLIPKPDIKTYTTIGVKKVLEGLAQVSHIATVSEIYPEISGTLVSFEKDGILFVATDSFRLAKKEIKEHIPKEIANTAVILPLRSVNELLYILDQTPATTFKFGVNENQALFLFDDVHVVSRLLSGSYPQYNDLIPKDFSVQVVLNRQEFIEKVKLISVFAPKTNDCKIEIGKAGLRLSSTATLGSSEATLKAKVKGSGISEIIFNYRYLLDGLAHIKSEEVELRIKTESNPIIFHGVGDESYLYLAAPLKR
jgi:DNA polymerase III subunit beta